MDVDEDTTPHFNLLSHEYETGSHSLGRAGEQTASSWRARRHQPALWDMSSCGGH